MVRPEASRILVVDDEPTQRSLIKGTLSGLGYRPTAVASGPEALKCLEVDPPDAIILDIHMPVMSGYEVLGRLRSDQRFKRIPVVIVTGEHDADAVGRCLGLGADDYLTVPFHPTILDARVSRVLGRQNDHDRDVLELVRRMDALRTLADGVAHDFKNILATIRYRAEAIRRSTAEPQIGAMSTEIIKADELAAEIIDSLETFARGSAQPSSPIDLGAVVDEVLGQLVGMMPEEISLRQKRDGSDPYWVAGHAADLARIVLNLVLNARNAMPDGGKLLVTLGASDQADLEAFDDYGSGAVPAAVKLQVCDDGQGIPSEILPKIFDPYFTTGRGRGLGLAIVHGLVKGLGGVLNVRSQPCIGTTFTLQLPRLSGSCSEVRDS